MKNRLSSWLPCGLFLVLFLWFFGRAILGQQDFVFRDAAHFYYPLFHLIQAQWNESILPLWSPYDGIGSPLLADGSSSVFYPAKLLFFLPIGYGQAYRLYIVLHYLLAFVATYYLAKSWRRSSTAAAIAALSYAMGGYVLCQHANVVFLIGCAWHPFALLCIQRIVDSGSWKSSVGLSIVLSMMILGGDPQMAYLSLLLAVVYLAITFFSKSKQDADESKKPLHISVKAALLLFAVCLTIGLTAIQVFPTYVLSKNSSRAHFDQPRSVYELAVTGESEGKFDTLLGKVKANTHERQLYQFSVAPWRWPELVWPNFSGKMYPENSRWANAIPGEGRVWSPTLYAGLLPFLLLFSAFNLRSAEIIVRWMSWVLLLGLIASLGWYGLGWVYIELGYSTGLWQVEELSFGQPLGGLYWAMVTFLPKFAEFRYPAKLWAFVAIASSMLAAYGWDIDSKRNFSRLRLALKVTASVSCLSLVVVFLFQNRILGMLQETPSDSLFGPLQAQAGLNQMMLGIGTSLLISLTILLIPLERERWLGVNPANYLLIILTADLMFASAWLVQYNEIQSIDYLAMDQLQRLESHSSDKTLTRAYRNLSNNSYPKLFAETTHPERQSNGMYWDYATLFPRYQLLLKQRNIRSSTSISNIQSKSLWQVAVEKGKQAELARLLGGEFQVNFLIEDEKRLESLKLVQKKFIEKEYKDFIGYYQDTKVFPATWIVHQATVLPKLEATHRQDFYDRAHEVLFDQGEWRDFNQEVVLETNELPKIDAVSLESESAKVIGRYDDQIMLEIDLSSSALVVIQESYNPGWKATIRPEGDKNSKQPTWRHLPIYRANRIMQAVVVPPGKHRVRLKYEPIEFQYGAIVSLACWFCLICLGILLGLKKYFPFLPNLRGQS